MGVLCYGDFSDKDISSWQSGILLSHQKADSVNDDQVQGIINIEDIFHLQLSARAVIEREWDQCEKGYPLIINAEDRKEGKRNAKADELSDLARRGENDHWCQYAPDAVIHAVVRIRQKMGESLHQKNGCKENAGKEQPSLRSVLLDRMVERVDQNDGEGECDEDTLVKRSHRKEVDKLAEKAQSKHLQKVFGTVFGIFCALCDHISENGKRQSADETEDPILRKKLKTCVVAGHGDQSKDLQLIARKSLEQFRFHNITLFSEMSIFFSIKQKMLSCQEPSNKNKNFQKNLKKVLTF